MTEANGCEIDIELHYRDPEAALRWLSQAFGFETRMTVTDAQGALAFAETGMGGETIAITRERPGLNASPKTQGGSSTQTVQIRMTSDVTAHCAKARDAGAEILSEPKLYFFGDRTYLARDPEGHVWSFAQRIPGAGGPPPKGWIVGFPGRDDSAAP